MKRMMLIVGAISIFGSTAFAQARQQEKKCTEVNGKKCKVVEIEDEVVKGEIIKPNHDMFTILLHGKEVPLIPNRTSMVDKISKSGNDQ
jgi:hypothetical protein